ncbi:dihydrofolate reductase [Scleropages formosus]|uniref:dihydrofolate reductase n=1 Tax=Scleropages formosus TaxID=113540 RepID=A0A8C9QU80_SCLFO|nr:dihydrofolate reductase-like [Scleropages formosus]
MFVQGGVAEPKPIRLIAAACKNRGIGREGELPWNLPKEFRFFLDTITMVSNPDKKNLLVWGKHCWFSTPESLHPFANSLHVVLSRTLRAVPQHAHYICSDFDSVIRLACTPPLDDLVETIWITGGVGLYREALEHPWCDLIFLTDIMADFDCDTFFPEFDQSLYRLQDRFPGVPDEIQEECGIRYKFQVFKKDA